MHPGEATRDGTEATKELIWRSDGFAQVLPKDKREVVMVLKNHFKTVVGMTGDGVNDAPALSAAQCGIAVDDATDAAKNAAAIILTTPGLSAIYSAVVESRRIFRKLKAYVTYRFAATIQIVMVLSMLIFISNCPIDSLYVILLALFNDITMLPIAYDRQLASKNPETPEVSNMLLLSLLLGVLETAFSLAFAYGADRIGWFESSDDDNWSVLACDTTIQAAVWLQMSIAAELLIFSARAPSYMWTSILPSSALFFSVMAGCIITSFLAGVFSLFGGLQFKDIMIIWTYDLVTLVFIDIAKVFFLRAFNQSQDTIDDVGGVTIAAQPHGSRSAVDALMEATRDSGHSITQSRSRIERLSERLSEWDQQGRKSHASKNNSQSMRAFENSKSYKVNESGDRHGSRGSSHRISIPGSPNKTSRNPYKPTTSNMTGRTSLASGSVRPNTPANKLLP